MAKNPLWILESLGPVMQDYVDKQPRRARNSNVGEFRYLVAIMIDRLPEFKEKHMVTPAQFYLRGLGKLAQTPAFLAYALDTIPRNSVEYHALLDFMRYYG